MSSTQVSRLQGQLINNVAMMQSRMGRLREATHASVARADTAKVVAALDSALVPGAVCKMTGEQCRISVQAMADGVTQVTNSASEVVTVLGDLLKEEPTVPTATGAIKRAQAALSRMNLDAKAFSVQWTATCHGSCVSTTEKAEVEKQQDAFHQALEKTVATLTEIDELLAV